MASAIFRVPVLHVRSRFCGVYILESFHSVIASNGVMSKHNACLLRLKFERPFWSGTGGT